jgi:hypothetical protein
MQQVGKNKFPNGKRSYCFENFNNTCQMKIITVLLLAIFLSPDLHAIPVSVPIQTPHAKISTLEQFSRLPIKEIQKIAGRKLKLKERIAIKIVQWKIKKQARTAKKQRADSKPGRLALVFSILALLTVGIPAAGLFLAPVFAILGLIFGYKAKRENPNDKQARTAVTLSWIALAIFVVVATISIAFMLQGITVNG